MRIAIVASGSGTNLQALLDAHARGELGPCQIVAVAANVPGCGALARAEAAHIPTIVIDHKAHPNRASFEKALGDALIAHGAESLIMAGFMRLVGEDFLNRFPAGVVNIHPALLPAFPGVDGQGQAHAYGVRFAGCTVHFVDGGIDSGPIIAQAVVPVRADDTADGLKDRILEQEHLIFPAAVRAHVEGRITRQGRQVTIKDATPVQTVGAWRSL